MGVKQSVKKRLLASPLFHDSFWALMGNVFGKGLALLGSILVARMLGKDLYGMYGLVRTTLLSIAVFTTFGLGYTATKYIAEYLKSSKGKVYSLISNIMQISFAMAFVCASIIFIFSKQIATYLSVPELYNSMRLLAVIVVFNSITTTQIGVLAGFKCFKQIARINLVNGIVIVVLSVLFTYLWGLDGALIALLISQMVICGQFYVEVLRSKKIFGIVKSNEKYSFRREITLFSLPIAMQEAVYSIQSWLLPILIVKFSTFGEVGLYNAAMQWSSVILFLPGTLRNVILSHVSSISGQVDQQAKLLNRMLLINFTATAVPCLLVFCFSGLIVKSYGSTFTGLVAVLNFSVFTTIFSTMSNVVKQYFLAIEKAWFTLWTRILNVFFSFGLFILLMRFFDDSNGALRMTQAILFTQILFFCYWFLMYKKFNNATIKNKI